MKTYGTVLVWILCIIACALLGLTKHQLNEERAAYRELYNTRPQAEMIKEPKTGSVLLRVDGRHYYIFQNVCTAVRKT